MPKVLSKLLFILIVWPIPYSYNLTVQLQKLEESSCVQVEKDEYLVFCTICVLQGWEFALWFFMRIASFFYQKEQIDLSL